MPPLGGLHTAARENVRRRFAAQSSAADFAPESALVCGLVGDVDCAEKTIRGINERFPKGTLEQYLYIPLIQAGIEQSRGNPQKAIEVLQASLPYEPYGGWYGSVRANIFWRGRACYEAKRPREAAAEFEKVAAIPHPSPYYRWAHLWLARSWGLAGEAAKAREAYDRLFVMWNDAEPDFKPLLEARTEYAKLER